MAGQTSKGVWISYRADEFDSVTAHSAEIKALREAVKTGGASVFVHHGQSLKDAIAGVRGAAEGRIPGEAPLPDMPADPAEAPAPAEEKPVRLHRKAPKAEAL